MEKQKDLLAYREKMKRNLSLGLDFATTFGIFTSFWFPFPFSLVSSFGMIGSDLFLKGIVEKHYEETHFLAAQKDVQELQTLYQAYLEEVKKLFVKYGLQNPLTVSDYFEDMLWKGYFSIQRTFQYKKMEFQHYPISLLGARVMSGLALCRNISALYDDFSQKFDLLAPRVCCCLFSEKEEKLHSSPVGNHMINLLEINGKKLGRDITNCEHYIFVSPTELIEPTGENHLILEEDNSPRISQVLSLPALEEEEYQALKQQYRDYYSIPMTQCLEQDFSKLHQQSLPALYRICQIEESYTIPEIKKANVLEKECYTKKIRRS